MTSTQHPSKNDNREKIWQALWHIYSRPEKPALWHNGGNLPWNDPEFSRRMLREHLDQSHGAASRVYGEIQRIVDWISEKTVLGPGKRILDLTCGPGLYAREVAKLGCQVTGVDFSPAAIEYAREITEQEGLSHLCNYLEADVRQLDRLPVDPPYDVALFLYGQLAVFPRTQANTLLETIAQLLKPGGYLIVELLDQDRVDKSESTWWFTDNTGLWGHAPFLHLGERFWNEAQQISVERFHILHLETGQLDEITLCDQTYSIDGMTRMMEESGFSMVEVFPQWAGLPLYDAEEWVVYLASIANS